MVLKYLYSFEVILKSFKSLNKPNFRFTAGHSEMMAWWCEDLPLPYPGTSYAWARDTTLQVLGNYALHQFPFTLFQESLSFPGAIALNWCAVVACVRDYKKEVQHLLVNFFS